MTKQDMLTKLQRNEITIEEYTKWDDENQPIQQGSLSCKVSEKGAVSVYGLQRMPVTLYLQQWLRLLDFADTLRAFLKANDHLLARKPVKSK